MNYEFTSNNKDCFSLHDCRAVHVEIKDSCLTLYFPEGIFYSEYEDCWPNTGSAAVEYVFDDPEDIRFYLFKGKKKKKTVKEYSLKKLADKINSKKWQLEFLYRYDGYQEVVYTVSVWFNKKPWSYAGQIFIRNEGETFSWNFPPKIENSPKNTDEEYK
jgi:hypothetical protein